MSGQKRFYRDHLLDRLPDADRDSADGRSIVDRRYYEELLAEEQLLVEEFVAGKLSAADSRDFERQLGKRPELEERVLLERLSRRAVPAMISSARKWTSAVLPLAAAIAMLAVGSAWRFGNELARERQTAAVERREWEKREAAARARIAALEARAARPAEAPGPPKSKSNSDSRPLLPVIASFLIQPYTRGDSGEPRFELAGSPGRVELQFNIGPENRFTRYRVTVTTSDGSTVARATTRPSIVNGRFRVVSATVSSAIARGQHFEALVAGVGRGGDEELLASYAFVLYTKNE
jgi:hypothetical protein